MPPRERLVAAARLDGRRAALDLVRELKEARLDHSLLQRDVAAAASMSRSRYTRIEGGDVEGLTLVQLSMLLAAVGLRLTARAYPAGRPVRDAAHLELLGRLRSNLHPSLAWKTEVPLEIPGDLRAWDATIAGRGWVVGVEAETRPRDLQAVKRRVALKARDGHVAAVILLLARTRHNVRLVRQHRADLDDAFPEAGSRALELLGSGANPAGSALVLL